MTARILCYIAFTVLMVVDVLLSSVVVVLLYVPFVALKAAYLMLTGKVSKKPRASDPARSLGADQRMRG